MKNLLLTISVSTLLLAGQAALASDAHDKDSLIPVFNSVSEQAPIQNTAAMMARKVSFTDNKSSDLFYDAKSDITSLEYESDK